MADVVMYSAGPSNKKRKYSAGGPSGPLRLKSGPRMRSGQFSSGGRGASSSYARGPKQESGFVDLALASYAGNTTGSIVLLNTIPQGAGTSQRVGKRVNLKSLQCHGTINTDTTTTFASCAYLIVYDKRPSGVLPAITDILNTASSNSFMNDNNSGRFKVLKRGDYSLAGNTAAGSAQTGISNINAQFYLDLKMKPEVFKSAGTGAIGDIEEGAMYLVVVGDQVAGTADVVVTMGFRLRYIDA